MITIKLMGGLGNQLFQLFTCIAYGIKHKKKIVLSKNKLDSISPVDNISLRPTYWDSFLSKLKTFIVDENDGVWKQFRLIYKEESMYQEIPFTDKNIVLYGYFQSYKYFENIIPIIPAFLQLNEQKNNLMMKYSFDINTIYISLHFRIGDYKAAGSKNHPITSIEYYINSLNHILNTLKDNNKKISVLCFGENQSKDDIIGNINILIKNFPKFEFKFFNDNFQDYEEMILMSCCNHNIIANSTFSWWGAFLNNSSNKIVTYPDKWFGENIKKDVSDLFPNDWKCISS